MGREILVVEKRKLFENKEFKGFLSINDYNFTETILNNFEYRERNDELENNVEYIQIIPYVWILNKKEKKVFLYKRAPSKGEYKEVRHLNKYSGGVGGHIDKDTEENSRDPIFDAMIRELKEETIMNEYPVPEYFGYMYVDLTMFDKVHLGIVALAETEETPRPADGIAKGDFYSIEEADKILGDPENEVENWTKVGWPFVKNYLM